MSEGESDICRCRRCKKTFRVLDDEVGQHECPHCGYTGHEPKQEDDADAENGEEV